MKPVLRVILFATGVVVNSAADPLTCPEPAKLEVLSSARGKIEYCATADGQLHGPAREWYPNGVQRTSDNWQRGKQEGVWVVWDENGIKREEHSYRDGRLDGADKSYSASGKLEIVTCWREGKKHGPIAQWDDAGDLLVVGQHSDELMEGDWYFRHHETGQVIRVKYHKGKDGSPIAASFPEDTNGRITCR